MLKEKEIAIMGRGIKRGKTGYTTEKTKEEKKAPKLQKENEELQRLVQNKKHMLKEQKESIDALRARYYR